MSPVSPKPPHAPADSSDRGGQAVVPRSRTLVLLGALFAQIALNPFISDLPLLGLAVQVGLVLAAVYVTADSKHHLCQGLALGLPALVAYLMLQVTGHQVLGWAAYAFALLLYLLVIRIMLARIFRAPVVTLDVIGMALCTYVLLGSLWTLFYLPVHNLDPGAFRDLATDGGGSATASLTYFSYVTLTTLGYGDIVPVSEVARSLAILEALTGTLFLAVLISRLVGAYSRSSYSNSSRTGRS